MKNKLIVIGLFFLIVSSISFGKMESSFLRIDGDNAGTYFWFGGTNSGYGKTWAHEIIYYPTSNEFEMEIGPYFSYYEGKLDVCPMFGSWMNLTTGKTDYLLPQLYFYSTNDKFYAELWNMYYHGITAETKDYPIFYGRYFFTYQVLEWLSIGPQMEFNLNLADDDHKEDDEDTLSDLSIGGYFSWPYGENNTMSAFIGVDTKNDNKAVCRFTFVRYF